MPRVRRVATKSASKDHAAAKTQDNALLSSQAVASGLKSPPDAAPSAANEPDDFMDIEPWLHMNLFVYYVRQHGAIVLCIVAMLGIALGTGGGSESWSSMAMIGWLSLMLVALAVHEFRPYHGPGWGQMYKARQVQAGLDEAAAQALVQSKEE